MAKILKICWGPWENASRDKRELSAYRELGHDVLVLAEGDIGDRGRDDTVEGFPVKRISAKPFGSKAHKRVNQLSSWFTWAAYASTLKPDVISGHDWIGWTIGRMSCAFKRKKPVFIYDAHEFELGRNASRNRLMHLMIRRIEKSIINKSAFSIMVNDSIADKVQEIYRLKKRPIVVRSTPDYWEIDSTVCEEYRQRFLDKFKELGADVRFIAMYHGMLMNGRGIELLIKAAADIDGVGIVIVGNGQESYISGLRRLAAEQGLEDRVMIIPAVSISDLWKVVGAADTDVSPIEPIVASYYLSLPNKFFESIQSMTPLIVSDLPEMKKLIEKYDIGLTFKPGDAVSLSNCIRKLRDDRNLWNRYKVNLKRAKEELCWDNEKEVLIREFKKIKKI